MTPKPPSGTWINLSDPPAKPVAHTLPSPPLDIIAKYASSKPVHRPDSRLQPEATTESEEPRP